MRHPHTTFTTAQTALLILLVSAGMAMAEWKNVTEQNNAAVPGDSIQFIEEGPKGVVWIGGLEGLTRYEKGTFTPVMYNKVTKRRNKTEEKMVDLKSKVWDILHLEEDRWLVARAGAVSIVEGTTLKESPATGFSFAPVVRGHNGAIWTLGKAERNRQQITCIMERGVDGKWRKVEFFSEKTEDGKKRDAEALFVDSEGTFWVTIPGNGIIHADPAEKPGEWPHYLKGYNITTFGEGPDGHVWCGLWERGVTRFDEGAWQRHLSEEDTVPLAICGSGKDTVWVATNDRGVFRKEGDKWHQYFEEEGAINLLKVTDDGRVWISSAQTGGLRSWNGKEWETALPGPLPIRDVVVTKDGTVIAGGVLDGLHMMKK